VASSLIEMATASSSVGTPSPAEVFALTRAREEALSRVLIAFVCTGLFFMLFPGTFLGVWNLLQISGRESIASISPAWLQAHGHAQVFGWVGSFILGIGLYSIPKLRDGAKTSFVAAWVCWTMWTVGAATRWAANVYLWQWRTLLPFSAALELAAFVIFFRAVSGDRTEGSREQRFTPWILVVISASVGLFSVLVANLAGCIYISVRGTAPAFPHVFDQRFLVLVTWGFLVPFVWGFSAKWMSIFLGLQPTRTDWLLSAVAINLLGIVFALCGYFSVGSLLFAVGASFAVAALRMFQPAVNEPKTRGIHSSFPFFIRMAYLWLLVAAGLGAAASRWDTSGGIWGASRHALTVGFVSVMIVSVGQRILPAFAGMRALWSTRLMFLALVLLTVGCALRVSAEVLAYQGHANWAWGVLPPSAMLELTALTLFAVNMFGTFVLQPAHASKERMVTRIAGSTH
jgi:uncharacterized protein involved in response to NO